MLVRSLAFVLAHLILVGGVIAIGSANERTPLVAASFDHPPHYNRATF